MKHTYFVYLDEFGHVGPFTSRNHPQHNTSPVFGFGGIAIPSENVRWLSTWFYKLKCNLLQFEIARDGIPAHQWEKKGSSLFTTTNVTRYQELRKATNRLLNAIRNKGGFVIYVGLEKQAALEDHHANNMTLAVLREVIKRLDEHFSSLDSGFIMFLDHRDDKPLRDAVVTATQQEMYGPDPRWSLLEAPTQVESHRYQLVQAADWLCGLIGRIETYRVLPNQYPELSWSKTYFADRLSRVSIRSGVRLQTNQTPASWTFRSKASSD